MTNVFVVLLIVFGIIFVGSVLLQSPKGGLGSALGGIAAGGGDYGSKKSLETTLKKVSWVTGIVFVLLALLMPYMV